MTVLDSPTVMDGVLVVAFVVGGQGGQGSPISRTQMEAILQREGPNLARALSAAVSMYYSARHCSSYYSHCNFFIKVS